jgi:hypothetical protein
VLKFNGQQPRLPLAHPTWGNSVTVPTVKVDVNCRIVHEPDKRVPPVYVTTAVGLEVTLRSAEEVDVDVNVGVVVLTSSKNGDISHS